MFYFNLLVIFLVDFHVYFGLLLSERAHLKGSSEKKGTSTENFGGREEGGGGKRPLFTLYSGGAVLLAYSFRKMFFIGQNLNHVRQSHDIYGFELLNF